MNYKRKSRLIRQYWQAQRAVVLFGFARTDDERERFELLKERLASAEAKLERNGITMDDAIEEKVRQGWA